MTEYAKQSDIQHLNQEMQRARERIAKLEGSINSLFLMIPDEIEERIKERLEKLEQSIKTLVDINNKNEMLKCTRYFEGKK